jgi:pilus assembly protein Flp/PilA
LDHPAKEDETMLHMWTALETRFTDEEGASLVEYALLVALIAIVALLAITAVGSSVSSNFQDIADTL